jgi:hypothetical protein
MVTTVLGIGILGIEVPDDRPVFLAALAVHVAAGLTCVVSGALAATARKRPGRQPVPVRSTSAAWRCCSPPRRCWRFFGGPTTGTCS